jgi:hypothetical protein
VSPSGDPGEWHVSAAISPGPQEPAAKPDPDPLDLKPQGWHEAAEGVRTALKWLVTALAAVGAALFAKGFITTPQLSWTDNRAQLLWALGLGAVAILSVATLIAIVVQQLRPALFDLNHLPEGLNQSITKEPRAFLPSDCADLDDYQSRFNRLLAASEAGKREVAQRKRAHEDAVAAQPQDAGLIAQTQEDVDLATEGYDRTIRNLGVYKSVRTSLFDRAEYFRQSTAFNEHLPLVIAAAFLAAVCGVGYQLALSTPKEPPKSEGASPVVGELIAKPNAAARQLWSDLHLKGCQRSPTVTRIAVLVASGDGTTSSPYVVTTLPTATCAAQTFTVINEVATITKPEPHVIEYTPETPAATATTS